MTLLGRSTATDSPVRVDAAATQVFWVLRVGFTVLPIVFGLDKFTNLLADWTRYLAPQIDRIVPGTAHQAMLTVGMVEVAAGLLVAVLPRFGGLVGAARLAGVIGDFLLLGGYYDVALRDFGLLLASLGLARLAWAFPRPATPTAISGDRVRQA